MLRTRITCPLDFDKDGKQVGHLRLPHSSNTSAYGWIGIPIAVIRNGSGPTVYLGAGNHGDEYEGQITLVRLIRELDPKAIQGRLIILPAENLPAAMNHSRCSPIDGGNLNRSFPGEPDAPDHRPTEAIAYYIANALLPMCDVLIDLHSGGKTLDYVPSALIRRARIDDAMFERSIGALRAFGAPIGYIVEGGSPSAGGGDGTPRTLPAYAESKGIMALGTELGGAGTLTPRTLRVARRGVYNTLAHLGLIEDNPYADERTNTRLVSVGGTDYYVHAPCRGAFEPAFALGDEVEAGQLCGLIHQIDDPSEPPREVRFERSGVAFCKRPITGVERGDCLAHLGTDWKD
jgi:predicted deacylase